jgi:hypothetical protein
MRRDNNSAALGTGTKPNPFRDSIRKLKSNLLTEEHHSSSSNPFLRHIKITPKLMATTRKRLSAILFILFALLAIAGLRQILRPRPHDPIYKDKRLSVWLKGYDDQNKMAGTEWQAADEAVRDAGTNAIPTLLKMLRAKDSDFTFLAIRLIRQQTLVKNPFPLASELNNRGSRGLQRLGIDATNAVPALVEIFNQHISDDSRNGAALALGAMGPAAKSAVPSLLTIVKSPDPQARSLALYVLGEICAEPDTVVPLLSAALQDPDTNVRKVAAFSLSLYEKSARSAVPALMQALNDPDYQVRRRVLRALEAIDPAAAKKAKSDEKTR